MYKIIEQKTKTQLLLEKMERGEYVSDSEYLGSIPGFWKELDEAYNEVLNTPEEQKIRTLEGWDV
ncbi:MAG: hypothetical protein FWG85_00550 [Bacteroidetes bacterium]|nr:hypothetical protein [Bacteroidota bacterium]